MSYFRGANDQVRESGRGALCFVSEAHGDMCMLVIVFWQSLLSIHLCDISIQSS